MRVNFNLHSFSVGLKVSKHNVAMADELADIALIGLAVMGQVVVRHFFKLFSTWVIPIWNNIPVFVN
jgi:hypothetical protein